MVLCNTSARGMSYFCPSWLLLLFSNCWHCSCVRLSVCPIVQPPRWVCSCGPCGQEIWTTWPTAANAGSVTLSADVGSWIQTCLMNLFTEWFLVWMERTFDDNWSIFYRLVVLPFTGICPRSCWGTCIDRYLMNPFPNPAPTPSGTVLLVCS